MSITRLRGIDRLRATAFAIVIGITMISIAGCPLHPSTELVWIDDFETLCDGLPCGWAQVRGEEPVTFVETIPGDHGFEIVGDDVVIGRSDSVDVARPSLANVIVARIVARCDRGSSLEVRVTIQGDDEDDIFTFSKELVPDSEWNMAFPDETLDPDDTVPLGPWFVSRVLGVSVLKRDEGACEIDYIAIRASP